MTQREAFHSLMAGERPDTLCQFEQGFWWETIVRWRTEGLPQGRMPWDDCGICTYERPNIQQGIFPLFPVSVIEKDADTETVRMENGVICRRSTKGTAFPQFIKHPVETRDDFETLKQRLDPATPGRYPSDWSEWCRVAKTSSNVICIGRRENGFFGWLRELIGVENLLMAYYDQPELIHAICRHQVGFLKGLYEKALQEAPIDFVFMWEDMAFKTGPLISPELFREFMLPYYLEIVGFYREMGVRWISVDSDGNINKLIPLFLEAGIDMLLPFEVAAGMDIREVRSAYPNLKIAGGIDKRRIALGRKEIDDELESKLPELFASGGYLPCMDHHVPPDVSYNDFKYYLARCREIYRKTCK